MINRTVDITEIALTPEENHVLLEIRSAGVIPDTHWQEEPYNYFIRLNLIEHTYSDKFPYTYPDGEIAIPRNALCLTDKGRCYIARLEEEARLKEQQAQQMAEQTAEQKATHERERREDFILAAKARRSNIWAAIIGAVVGSVVTLVVEHFGEILEFIRSFWETHQ